MPNYAPILISLSPNTERDDIVIAARSLVTCRRWRGSAQHQAAIEKKLSRMLGDQSVTLTTSGRGALYEALRAAGLGAGDEIILQAFTCLAVPAAVRWAGATPVYADINPDTYSCSAATVKPHITPRTKAIIIQHTFGIPAPLDELLTLAREHNLLVIEDIAHGLGGQYKGRPLGSFGDIAILSFGRDKIVSCVFGGAVVTRHQEIHDAVRHTISAYPTAPAWWVTQQLLHPLIINAAIPFYFTGPLGKMLLVAAQRSHLVSYAVSRAEKTAGEQPPFMHYSFPAALLPSLANQLNKLARFTVHRRRIAKQYLRHFPASSYMKTTAEQAAWLRFPLVVPDKQRVATAAQKKRILLGDWYTAPVAPCSLDQQAVTSYVPGSCPQAERAAEHVVNLPTHPRLKSSDIERVINFMADHD